jgi:hypothetical protein
MLLSPTSAEVLVTAAASLGSFSLLSCNSVYARAALYNQRSASFVSLLFLSLMCLLAGAFSTVCLFFFVILLLVSVCRLLLSIAPSVPSVSSAGASTPA